MELIKLITLSVLVTVCCAQGSGDMPSDEPIPSDELIPTPAIILVTATRAYRDNILGYGNSTYQTVYNNTNGTNAYDTSAPHRYARYNVSNLLIMTLLKIYDNLNSFYNT